MGCKGVVSRVFRCKDRVGCRVDAGVGLSTGCWRGDTVGCCCLELQGNSQSQWIRKYLLRSGSCHVRSDPRKPCRNSIYEIKKLKN